MDERTAEVIAECKTIIEAIEGQKLPLSRVALGARRLAQLLDDDAAFMWLSMECTGADGETPPARPWKDGSHADAMKGAEKYVMLHGVPDFTNITLQELAARAAKGEIPEKTRVAGAPLAELEVAREPMSKEEEQQFAAVPGGQHFLVTTKALAREHRKLLERVAAAIHEWATNVYVVHRFRQAAGNIFDRFKTHADGVLARLCPEAIAKLGNAVEKASSDKPEDWSAAALSCRRVLHDFADAVYPPSDEPVEGRSVSKDKHKNRLWAFAKKRGSKAIEKQFLAIEEIDGLCKTLDRVYEWDSKGVHDSVTKQGADLAVLRTYILLEQLAQLVGDGAPA